MPSVHLVVTLPGLLRPPGADGAPPRRAPDARGAMPVPAGPAPALARLIAAAGAPVPERDGIGAALAPHYGVTRQCDWPLAAIRAAALGVEPGAAYWLAADPVTLEAGRDDLRLTGAVTDLAPGEAAALIATLNAHFRADGLVFVAPRPGAWFVATPGVQEIATRPLAAAVGRSLRLLLPAGKDAGKWQRWHSEIQMLLHEHPVNAARERAGRAPVNSVWLDGGGTHPAPAAPAVRTFANGGIAAALAAHAGQPAAAVPAALDAALAAAGGATTIVVALDAAGDVGAVERAWAAPAWATLASGAIESVALIADGDGAAVVWAARRPRGWERIAARLRAPDLASLLAAARAASGSGG